MEYLYRTQRLMSVIVKEITTITVPPTSSQVAAGIDYFFALLPDDDARVAITDLSERFRKSHRAIGSPVSADRLFLPLCPKGKPEQLRKPLETALLDAAAAVRLESFSVVMDSAMRFSARDGQFPFVLCADGHTIELALQLRKSIASEQARVGLRVSGVSSYLPHVVLIEGRRIEAIGESIAPIEWKVEDFVLIRSFFGCSRHQVIGRWPLGSKPESKIHEVLDELPNRSDLPDIDAEMI